MTKDDIIRMARESDIDPYDMCEDHRIAENNLERFAKLVAAHEREACAKVCEELLKSDDSFYEDFSRAPDCAAAIRVRGYK